MSEIGARGNYKDILLGALLFCFALGGYLVNGTYEIGSASRMGPGYVPLLVFGLIAAFGLGLLFAGFRGAPEGTEKWAWRQMGFVLSSMTGFAFLLETAGMAVAITFLVLVSCLADRTQTLKGALGLTGVLILGCWLIFDVGLKIGIPFLPSNFGFG